MRACEVCHHTDPEWLLDSERLDGPLVRCPRCGLIYVGTRRHDFTFAAAADLGRTRELGELVDALGIVAREVESAEAPVRLLADRERLADLLRHTAPGRLLDLGSALGSFVEVALAAGFQAEGVEPDPGTAEQARARGLPVRTGTLEEVGGPAGRVGPLEEAGGPAGRVGPLEEAGGPGGRVGPPYDVITMFHVIEHLDSPRAALEHVRGLLRPGGLLMLETPTVENLWFRLAPARWRQLIPDHYWFFSAATLARLLRESGFRVLDHRTVGRRVTLRFAADRARRAGLPAAGLLARAIAAAGVAEREVHLNPGDIMRLVARAV